LEEGARRILGVRIKYCLESFHAVRMYFIKLSQLIGIIKNYFGKQPH